MHTELSISEFGKILIFMILGIVFILLGYATNYLLKKRNPNEVKNSSYECGEEALGDSRIPFNTRFYVIAIIFLLFDVELVFLFPWATVFADQTILSAVPTWGIFNLLEIGIFISLLLIGLVYVWRKGDLEWMKPQIVLPVSNTKIPYSYYEAINQKKYEIKEFSLVETPAVEISETAQTTVTPAPASARRPPFRSAIKKENNE